MLAQITDLRLCVLMSLRPYVLASLCPCVLMSLRPYVLRPYVVDRWPGDSEWTNRFRVKLPPVLHTQWRLHTVPLIAESQAGKL